LAVLEFEFRALLFGHSKALATPPAHACYILYTYPSSMKPSNANEE
jgi:hypothetical protein